MKFKLKPWAICPGMSKLFLVMKLTVAFLFILLTQVHAGSLAQNITIHAKNIAVEKVLIMIEKQSGYHFIYDSKLEMLKTTTVTVNADRASVNAVLDQCLTDLPVSYSIIQQTIALKGTNTATVSQEKDGVTVTGTVTDEQGLPLPGVSVLLKGSSKGAVTTNEGKYTLRLPDGKGILVFTFIGYTRKEVPVNNQTTINIVMASEAVGLSEVIAVGYGTKKKREITGAISSIGSKDIGEQVVTGLDQAMAGRIAGVQIVQNSSTPGGSTSIRLRGVGTPGVNEPLFVIDGFPQFPSDGPNGGGGINVLNTINPEDIQSIEVLKDAASAAIYGSRAANGVILVTTKKGSKGAPKLSAGYYYGLQTFEKRIDMLDAADYKKFLTERKTPFTDSQYNTNWLAEITRVAPMQNANLSISGGGENSTYFTSLGYLNQQGVVNGTDYRRFTARFNGTSNISKMLRIGENVSLDRDQQHVKSENNFFASAVGQALYYPPIVPVKEPGGQYGDAIEYVPSFAAARINPVANIDVGTQLQTNYKVLGNIYGEFEPIKNLIYKLNLGVDYQNTISDAYFPGYVLGIAARTVNAPYITSNANQDLTWLVEHTLTYKFTVAQDHNFNLLAGATQQSSRYETLSGSKNNIVSKDPTLTTLNSSPATLQYASGGLYNWSLASFLGRLDYNYKGRYLLSATVRHDGSSRFASGHQWGTFPSLSAGWVVSDEPFFKSNAISDLKIRASWGKLGNQEIAPYQYLSTLGNTQYVLNGVSVAGVYPNSIANPTITWETSEQKDIGFDLSLLKNKITFNFDYFDKRTSGILLANPISSVYGYTDAGGNPISTTSNSGVVSNKGFEFAINIRNSEHALKWSINANAATLKNNVESLGGSEPIINSLNVGLFNTKTDVSHQIGAFYGQVAEGIGPDGHMIFKKDAAGDNVQTFIGNPIPNFTYGANVNLTYKNFDFSLALQGVSGNQIYATTLYQIGDFAYGANNQLKSIYDAAGKTAPAVATATGADYAGSSWYVYSGAYLRVRSVQIGYNFPTSVLRRWGISKCRFYVSGQNLLTFDKYKVGLNPEVGAPDQSNIGAGVDQGTYPAARVFNAGINLTL